MTNSLQGRGELVLRRFLELLSNDTTANALAQLEAEGLSLTAMERSMILNHPTVAAIQRGKIVEMQAGIQDFATSELLAVLKYMAYLAKGGDEKLVVHPRDAASAARIVSDLVRAILEQLRYAEAPSTPPRTINIGVLNVEPSDIIDGALQVNNEEIRAGHFADAEDLFKLD